MSEMENKAAEAAEEKKTAEAEAQETKVEAKAEEVKEEAKAEVKEETKEEAKEPAKKAKKGKGGLIAIICAAVVAVVAIAFVLVAILSRNSAVNKFNAKDYAGAYSASRMAFFMDKKEKDQIAIGYVGKVLCAEGKYLEGAEILSGVDQTEKQKQLDELYKAYPYLGMCVEGAVVEFGTWEQDGDGSGEEPVEWIVLDVVKGDTPMALLLSKNVIGYVAQHSKTEGNSSYAKSEIHSWCEMDFYKSFNSSEEVKGRILQVEVETAPSSTGVDSGESVDAHVFAPSIQEIEKYLQGKEGMEQYITAAGNAAIKRLGAKVTNSDAAGYWLRNAGESSGFASAVTTKGEVTEGSSMSSSHGIRPMMWVKLG